MKRIRATSARVTLDLEAYDALRRQILERDNWRCQFCGSMKDLHVHHLTYRSQMGGDLEENLVTLCAVCHHKQHAGAIQPLVWFDF